MYERFFGFRDQPFRLTPDPKYLYLGTKHREGYAHLLFALREGSGFVAVTGEVGTGKTTLVRSLLREGHDNIAVAYIFNPVLSSVELLQTVNAEFGLPSRSTSKKELIETLNAFLLAQKLDGGRAVIIVDEAQNLDPAVLEQLRLLSNLETETDKLLQIILLGQPELRGLLDRTDLRQLAQRIALRWHLEPLDRAEVFAYVRHRVQVAGGSDGLFDNKALDLIYELSGGVPRLINILSHRSLLVAYTKGAKRVGQAEVHLAAAELEQCRIPLRARSNRRGAWAYKAAAVAGVAIAAGLVAFVLVAPLADDAHTTADRDGLDRLARLNDKKEQPSVPERATSGAAAEEPKAKAASKPSAASRPGTAAAVPESDPNAARELVRLLEASDPYEAAASSMSRLVELWTGSALLPAEIASGSLDLQLLGARRGLRYLSAELSVKQLRTLDLPAVVELRVGGSGQSRYVLVEALDDQSVELGLDKPVRAKRSVVEGLWSGNVHLLWRDPERFGRPITKGASGAAVEKLQALLAEAGYLKAPPSGQYDDATQEAVRRLQTERGLQATGDATTLTQIILYNCIRRYERPDLVGANSQIAKTLS